MLCTLLTGTYPVSSRQPCHCYLHSGVVEELKTLGKPCRRPSRFAEFLLSLAPKACLCVCELDFITVTVGPNIYGFIDRRHFVCSREISADMPWNVNSATWTVTGSSYNCHNQPNKLPTLFTTATILTCVLLAKSRFYTCFPTTAFHQPLRCSLYIFVHSFLS